MPPKIPSKVWDHMAKTPGGGICNYCKENISGKGGCTSNLAQHLRRKHGIETRMH